MKPIRLLNLSVLAGVLAMSAAHAENGSEQEARLGEHPAVIVARRGVQPDPTANFYLHPARLAWDTQRPLTDGEHPAVLVARRASSSTIDPNRFVVAHPARGTFSRASR